jgi:hypothetical protein
MDPVIPTLFPKDGPVSGVAMKHHRGVTSTEEERMEFWIEGAGGGKVELHTGFLVLTHCNNRPLVSDAAEERKMVLLEEGVAMFPREEAGGFPRETSEAWDAEAEEEKRKQPDSEKPEAGFGFPGRDAGDEKDGGVNLGGRREGWLQARRREPGQLGRRSQSSTPRTTLSSSLWIMRTLSREASSAPVWLCSPPSCFIGSSTPTAAPLLSSAKGRSSLPTWPLGASRGDIFGSLLYAVGFQSTILAVQDALALRIQDHAAFIDDTGLFVDGRVVADAERTGAPVLLGNKDGSSAEPDLGAKLPGEHQVAEGSQ